MAPTTAQNSQRLDKLEEDLAAISKAVHDGAASWEEKLEWAMAKLEEKLVEKLGESREVNQRDNRDERRETGGGRSHEEAGDLSHQHNHHGETREGSMGDRTAGNWRYRKLDMPLFEGKDPDGLVIRAERYFRFYGLTEGEKLEAAVVGLDGEALSWLQWENGRKRIRDWATLKSRVYHQFRPVHAGSLYEQWMAVTQTGTVLDYRREFIKLAAPLEQVPEHILLAQFINGLCEEVRSEA